MTPAQYKYMKRAVGIEDCSRHPYPRCGVMWQCQSVGPLQTTEVCVRQGWINFSPRHLLYHTTGAGRRALAEYEKQGGEG